MKAMVCIFRASNLRNLPVNDAQQQRMLKQAMISSDRESALAHAVTGNDGNSTSRKRRVAQTAGLTCHTCAVTGCGDAVECVVAVYKRVEGSRGQGSRAEGSSLLQAVKHFRL